MFCNFKNFNMIQKTATYIKTFSIMVGSVGVSDEKRNECIKINGMNWKHLQEMNQINYDRQHF